MWRILVSAFREPHLAVRWSRSWGEDTRTQRNENHFAAISPVRAAERSLSTVPHETLPSIGQDVSHPNDRHAARSRAFVLEVELADPRDPPGKRDEVLTPERLVRGLPYVLVVRGAWTFRGLLVDGTLLRHYQKHRPSRTEEDQRPTYFFGYRGEGQLISVSCLSKEGWGQSWPARVEIRPMTTSELATWEAAQERETLLDQRAAPKPTTLRPPPPPASTPPVNEPTQRKRDASERQRQVAQIKRQAALHQAKEVARYRAIEAMGAALAKLDLPDDEIQHALNDFRAALGWEESDDGNIERF